MKFSLWRINIIRQIQNSIYVNWNTIVTFYSLSINPHKFSLFWKYSVATVLFWGLSTRLGDSFQPNHNTLFHDKIAAMTNLKPPKHWMENTHTPKITRRSNDQLQATDGFVKSTIFIRTISARGFVDSGALFCVILPCNWCTRNHQAGLGTHLTTLQMHKHSGAMARARTNPNPTLNL